MEFFLNVFLYVKFENICSVICLKYGSNIFCMKKYVELYVLLGFELWRYYIL